MCIDSNGRDTDSAHTSPADIMVAASGFSACRTNNFQEHDRIACWITSQKQASKGLCIREILQKSDFVLLRITHYNTTIPDATKICFVDTRAGNMVATQCRSLYAVKKYPHIYEYFVESFPCFNGTGSLYVCIR